jgi:hypothetical protein
MACQNAVVDSHKMTASNQKSAQRFSQLMQDAFIEASQNAFSRGGGVASAIDIDNDAGDLAGRAIAEEFNPESEHQPFLENLRNDFGNPTCLVGVNGQLFDTRQVSSKANHRIETNRLRDSTTGGLEMLQTARSSASRMPLHLDSALANGQRANGVGSSSAPGLSSMISPQAHVNDDQHQFRALSSSMGFGVEGGQYPDDRVTEMYGRVQQRSLQDSHAVPTNVHNVETGEVESVPVDAHATDMARDRFLFMSRDANVQVASTAIEQTLIHYEVSGRNPPMSQEMTEILDQIVAHRNSSPGRRASYPN